MQIREIDSSDCMLARSITGEQLGTTLGTSGGYTIDTVLLNGRIVSGYGTMFIPLGLQVPEPTGENWTKIIVTRGSYEGNFGYVRISEELSENEAMQGLLLTH